MHRHSDREGVPGASGRPEGHVQLLSMNTVRSVESKLHGTWTSEPRSDFFLKPRAFASRAAYLSHTGSSCH